jgi:hypothetical protein
MSDRTTYAERAQARAVARFIAPRITARESWLTILACVSRRFPGVSLHTALCGYVFHRLLVAEKEPRPLPYRQAERARGLHRPRRGPRAALEGPANSICTRPPMSSKPRLSDGLVTLLGQDAVQQIITEAFRKVREDAP